MKAALQHRIVTRIARRKDIVLAGGVCGIPDEKVRHWQRRKDVDSEAARPKGQHTHAGIRREDFVHACQTSKRRKVGTAIPSRSVRGDAELVVGGSGCHRARNGDQVPCSEHQESTRVGDGTLTEYSECEPSHGPRMAATMHSTFKSKCRDP